MKHLTILLTLLLATSVWAEEKGLACSFLGSDEPSYFFLIDSANKSVKGLTSETTSEEFIYTSFSYRNISWEKDSPRGGEYSYLKYSLDRRTLRLKIQTIMPVIEEIMNLKPTELLCGLVSHQELIAGYKKNEETIKKGIEMLMEDLTKDNKI